MMTHPSPETGVELRRSRRLFGSLVQPRWMLLLPLMVSFAARAQAQDYTYTTKDGQVALTRYVGSNAMATIPGTIDGLPVTRIKSSAFQGLAHLEGVTIPTSVTTIEPTAFSGCTSLRSITIPPSVTTIEGFTFSGCKSLSSLTIPDSVSTISVMAFRGCTGLTTVTIPSQVITLGDSAFSDCFGLTEVTILGNITTLGIGTFAGCRSLASFTIPSSVTTISSGVLSGCRSLTSVTIQNGVTRIGGGTFQGCRSLENIIIPGSVTTIWDGAFGECRSLQSVMIPSSVTTIERYVFSGCTRLSSIGVAPNNPKYSSLDGVLFSKNLTTLIQYPGGKAGTYAVPSSVTTVEDQAFRDCVALTAITVDASHPRYSSLDGVLFNKTLTTVMQYPAGRAGTCFLPGSVVSIDPYAFSSCPCLTAFVVEPSNTLYSGIEGSLFNKSGTFLIRCPGAQTGTYLVRSAVTIIGSQAFADCGSLEGVGLPNGVTTLRDRAFSGCVNLASIRIPASVTDIGDEAFRDCARLTGVYFQGQALPILGEGVFDSADHMTVYYLPELRVGSPLRGRPAAVWRPRLEAQGRGSRQPCQWDGVQHSVDQQPDRGGGGMC